MAIKKAKLLPFGLAVRDEMLFQWTFYDGGDQNYLVCAFHVLLKQTAGLCMGE